MVPPRRGDRVHVAGFGSGVVQDIRNGGRCVVAIKGRAMVVSVSQLSPAPPQTKRRAASPIDPHPRDEPSQRRDTPTLDLHGYTVEEALERLDGFLNDALLAGHDRVRVIHGRSGGRVKAATHARLRELTPIRRFSLDPMNPGVTVIVF